MAKTLNARIITKHDTEANWDKATSFKPKLGEIIIYETPSNTIPNEYDWTSISRIKIGDGETSIKGLPFITDAYVLKETGKGLSTNDYTTIDKQKVDKIPNNPKYTDTTYEAGRGLGFTTTNDKRNIFYNTGIVELYTLQDQQGKIFYKQSNNLDLPEEDNFITLNLADTAFMEPSNFLIKEDFFQQPYVVELMTEKTSPGIIFYKTHNNNDYIEIKMPWLGKLAYLDNVGELSEIAEIKIQDNKPDENVPIWISLKENGVGILNYYNSADGEYTALNVGVKEITQLVDETNSWVTGFSVIDSENQTVNYDFGVLDIYRKDDAPGKLIFKCSEGERSLPIVTETDIEFLPTNTQGHFKVRFKGMETETEAEKEKEVQIGGFSSSSFHLSGGTITGDTIFSSGTASNSTNTGAVCITGGLGVGGNIYGNAVYGAVYNDYAEYRQSEEPIEPGYIVYSGDDGILHKTVGRLQFFEGVVSDTFGFSIGKTDKAKTPLAVAGRVLVYTDEELHAGNVICAGPHGKAYKMTKQEIKDHPDRIVGIVSEVPSYETWGEENIPVNGRVWIRVK